MREPEVVSVTVKPTENTTLQKLSPLDQIRLLLNIFNNSDVAELDANNQLSRNSLEMTASLIKFLSTAGTKLEDNKHESVTLSLSSKYSPYLDNVIDDKRGLGRYYQFDVHKRDLPPNIEYKMVIVVRRKANI